MYVFNFVYALFFSGFFSDIVQDYDSFEIIYMLIIPETVHVFTLLNCKQA